MKSQFIDHKKIQEHT